MIDASYGELILCEKTVLRCYRKCYDKYRRLQHSIIATAAVVVTLAVISADILVVYAALTAFFVLPAVVIVAAVGLVIVAFLATAVELFVFQQLQRLAC